MPGEQGVDLVDGMIRDTSHHIGQVGLRIEAVQPCRLRDGVDAGRALSSGIGPAKKVILSLM